MKRGSGLYLYIGARFASLSGDIVFNLFVVTFFYLRTGSALKTSLVLLAGALPAILFGKPAADAIDRLDLKAAMVLSDLFRFLVLAVLAFLPPTTGLFYAAVFLIGCGGVLFEPAAGKLFARLVDAGELVRANSLVSLVDNVVKIAVPMLGGASFLVFDVREAFLFNAASFFLSGLLVLGLPRAKKKPGPVAGPAGPGPERLSSAFWPLILFPGLFALLNGVNIAALPPFAFTDLAVSKEKFSLFFSTAGAGLLLGSAGSPLLARRLSSPAIVRLGLLLLGGSWVGYFLFRDLFTVLALRLLGSAAISIYFIHFKSFLQGRVDDSLLGRILAYGQSASSVMLLAGVFAGGLLAEFFSGSLAYLAAGLLAAGAALLAGGLLERFDRRLSGAG